jgi:hypothetical protein
MSNIYVTKNYTDDKSLDELDFELHDHFAYDDNKHDEFIVIEKGGDACVGTTPLNIDILISLLLNFKSKGANYIEMDHNPDHHGYNFGAFKIEKSTSEEVSEFNEKINNEKEKSKKLKELYKQISEIKKSK